MRGISAGMMRQMWEHGDSRIPGLLDALAAASEAAFAAFGLDNDTIVAHAMAQFSHECGAGTVVVESLNYSAQGLMNTWPSRFDAANAAEFARQPQRIANEVYNGRMGNRPGSDDGWTYRGRGGSQVTGRESYGKLGERLGLDLLGNPELVLAPEHFPHCAVADFVLCGCLPFAAADDLHGVTYHLNGGFIGVSQRQNWLQRWKAALGGRDPAARGTLWAQRALNRLGFADPPLLEDGLFGPATAGVLREFQAAHGLVVDGRIGPQTIGALETALAPQ